MKALCIALPFVAGLCVASVAAADPRLDEKVYSPYILNGVGELEVRTAGQSGGGVVQLIGIDVDRDHVVVWRELHRGASGRGNAERATAGTKRRELDRRVLVHPPEEHVTRT